MAFSEIEIYKINNFVGALCEKRAPESIRDKLRYEYKAGIPKSAFREFQLTKN